MPEVTPLRQRRREQTRREVVDAVIQVISEEGLDDATIDRVAKQSGISRGTIYAHFPEGREELLRSAYARLGRDLVVRSRSAVNRAADWAEALTELARELLQLSSDSKLGYFYNIAGPTLVTENERGIGSGASVALIADVLKHAQQRSVLGGDIAVEATAELLVGSLREAAISVSAGARPAEEVLTAFRRLVHGLSPDALSESTGVSERQSSGISSI